MSWTSPPRVNVDRTRNGLAARPEGAPPQRGLIAAGLLVAALQLSCGEDASTGPAGGPSFQALAGGGRTENSDPFIGGPRDSGPRGGFPGIPDFDPDTGLRLLVYLDAACGDAPARAVITDSTAWRIWWEANTACLDRGDAGDGVVLPGGTRPGAGGLGLPARPRGDGAPGDSGVVWPDSTDPGHWGVPEVDFTAFSVVAVTLERALDDPRMLVVDEIDAQGAGTRIGYTVHRPGEDCAFYEPVREDDGEGYESAPAAAVLAPPELAEPFAWERRDTTFSCEWEPDPDTPLALYYTDAPCSLGPAEQVLTTPGAWEVWVARAWDCDRARWGEPGDSASVPGGPDGGRVGSDGSAFGGRPAIPVDFDRFAVLVLRAGPQDRWGGGIWLTGLRTSAAGSAIEYVVIEPQSDCPWISEHGGQGSHVVEPTVAVRVPLPLPEPIVWRRGAITVSCEWTIGIDWTGPAGAEGRRR
ncbi:MAG: hypothetical protein FJY75_02495 [Candidatus Eisenbacteria bacterium]|uniref:Uncharacterized protein n=1 Tax=Eiseniibacteriota bacterium TaxID=2212470 RepID=A0A937X902_UNCEI|nr:hypothetical protein [Candidatus Eisenbacteria bacterium]